MTIMTGVPNLPMLGELAGVAQSGARMASYANSVAPESQVAAAQAMAQPTAQSIRQAQVMVYREQMNAAALQIRSADAAMADIGQKLGEMKAVAQVIVKQFPPFALDSQERIEFLNTISGLRRQIEALTLPAPDKPHGAMLADPAKVQGAGQASFASPSGEHYVIKAPSVHLGPSGLDLPELPLNATDAAVGAMLGRITQAETRLAAGRAGLAESVRAAMA